MGKKVWQSKTVWVNVIAIITSLGAMATGDVEAGVAVPAMATAAANIALRFMTKEPIGAPKV